MNIWRQSISVTRGLAIYAAVSLLLFLAASAPHRVHHFFERFSAAPIQNATAVTPHDHDDGQEHSHAPKPSPTTDSTDCALLNAAQNSHGLTASHGDYWVPFEIAIAAIFETANLSIASFSPAPNSQRAPPLV